MSARRRAEGADYMAKHGIEEAIKRALEEILRDRPDNPVVALGQLLLAAPSAATPKVASSMVVVAKADAELGEGPIWDTRHGRLLFLDILQSKIFSYSPTSGDLETVNVSKHTPIVSAIVPVLGPEWDDAVILGTQDGIALFDLDEGTFERHPASGTLHALPHTRMNDGRCDPNGHLWIGSIARQGPGGADLVSKGSALWVLDSWEATPVKVLDRITISNGMAWSVDGKTMWYTDSPTFGVDAFDFDADAPEPARRLRNKRRAIEVSSSFPPVPDGCALDYQGQLWVACFGAGVVRRFDPRSGALLCAFEVPPEAGTETTACAFGGNELDELYITTAHEFWSDEKKKQFPLAGSLFKLTKETIAAACGPGIRGIQPHYFKTPRGRSPARSEDVHRSEDVRFRSTAL